MSSHRHKIPPESERLLDSNIAWIECDICGLGESSQWWRGYLQGVVDARLSTQMEEVEDA